MPGFDGTGPRGEGPMTGGGFGYCRPGGGKRNVRMYPARGAGRGLAPWGGGRGRVWGGGRGQGGGRDVGGRGMRYYGGPRLADAPYGTPSDELNVLRNQADALEKEMKAVRDRIAQLEKRNG